MSALAPVFMFGGPYLNDVVAVLLGGSVLAALGVVCALFLGAVAFYSSLYA